MENANLRLINSVYQKMIGYKPSLQKVAANGSEEEEEERYAGQVLIKNLPLPVSIELRRLFSLSLRKPDKDRLEQILNAIENSLQLVSIILVSQLWHEKKQEKIVIPESFKKIFRQRIYLRNFENYISLIQSILTLFEERSVEPFTPEISKNLDDIFFRDFDFPFPYKNTEGSYSLTDETGSIEKLCLESEEKLILLLERLAFFVNYKLVSVQQIKVIKPKYQAAKYCHALKLLTCTDSDFNIFESVDSKCSDSHSVLFMKSQLPLTENLNLSPLVIDTTSFIGDLPSASDIKKDIYLYDGHQDSRIKYRGCRMTDKCDLTLMPDYPMLVAQFNDMIETITGQ